MVAKRKFNLLATAENVAAATAANNNKMYAARILICNQMLLQLQLQLNSQ